VEQSTPPIVAAGRAGFGNVATEWSHVDEQQGGEVTSRTAVAPGSTIAGRYEILQQLGEGGMGTVYKARDRELDRVVALKLIRAELARNPEILQRFKRELILARQVTHRNVVRIFDLGVTGDMKFITMEFFEGQTLSSVMAREKLSPAKAVEIMAQVCRGLDAAHKENVIHRDLKPQNIMVDDQERVVLMDFGLANSVEERSMTRTGALMGTPDYMSPEQAKAEKVDARSDVFSMGLIFYELLTGKLPFQSESLLGTLLARTQQRAAPVRELDPQIPQMLSDIVAKCLANDPAQRYQSAGEIVNDLEIWQSGATGKTTRISRAGPRFRLVSPSVAWKWISLSVSALVALLVVVWVLVEKGPLRSAARRPAPPPLSLAILPFRNVKSDPALDWMGSEVAAMLRTDVGQSARLQTISTNRITQILHDLQIAADTSIDPDTLQRIADSTSADRLLWGQFVKFGDQIQIDANLQDVKGQRSFALKASASSEKELPKAIEQLARDVQRSLALPSDAIDELQAKVLKPSTHSVQALRFYNEGLQLVHQGKNVQALESFRASVREDPDFSLAYAKMGQTFAGLGYSNEAAQSSSKALGLSARLPVQEKYLVEAIHAQTANDSQKAIQSYESLVKVLPEDSDVQFALAGLYNTVGAFDKSKEYYGRLLARDPKYVDALYGMAGVEVNTGNAQAALEYLNRALPITVQLENQQQKSAILYGLGMTYNQLNRPEDALRNYQQALEIQRTVADKNAIATTLNGMGQVQSVLGRSDESLKSFQEALRLRRDLGDRTGVGDTLIDLSNFHEARGQNEKALEMLRESLQIQREVGNPVNEALCLNNIGVSYADKGQYDDAITYFGQALALREKLKSPSGIADSNYAMAEALTKFGQYDKALTHYLRSLELWRSINDKRRAAFVSYGLGNLFEQQGRLGASLNAKEEALKTIREVQDRIGMAEILGGYADSLNLLARTDEAKKNADAALALAREVKNQSLVAQNLNFQGDNLFYQGEFKTARAQYEQALQVGSRAADRRLVLISKSNLAKLTVKEGRSRDVAGTLRTLAEEADALGLRYLAIECSVYAGEALLNGKDFSRARQELERALARSDKLSMRTLQAKSHYLLATVLRLSGKNTDGARHYAEAHRILDEMRKEAKSDSLLKRADLSTMYAESAKWSQQPLT
jgi:serine/threonine protein kinase/tetratricopeptide (TPR) repeat protein